MANQCEGGYFDQTLLRCVQCPSNCDGCNQDGCYTCQNYFQKMSDGSCGRCDRGYVVKEAGRCEPCHTSCGDKCIDSTPHGCLSCPLHQILNLESLTCMNQCPSYYLTFELKNHTFYQHNSQLGSPSMNYCRQPVIYFDPDNIGLELGTKAYPYSELVYGFEELIVLTSNKSQHLIHKVKFLLLEEKEHHIYMEFRTIKLLRKFSLTSYSLKTPLSPNKAIVVHNNKPPPIQTRHSKYLVLYYKGIDQDIYSAVDFQTLQGALKACGNCTQYMLVSIVTCQLYVENLKLMFTHPVAKNIPTSSIFFTLHADAHQRNARLENLDIVTGIDVYDSLVSLNIVIRNINIQFSNIGFPVQLFFFSSSTLCWDDTSQISFENINVQGGGVIVTVIYYKTRDILTISNFTIDATLSVFDTYFHIADIATFCQTQNFAVDLGKIYQQVTLDNIVMKNVVGKGGQIVIDTNQDSKIARNTSIELTNIHYLNFYGMGSKILSLSSIDPNLNLIIKNLTFENVTHQDFKNPMINMPTNQMKSVEFSNLTLKNCTIASQFMNIPHTRLVINQMTLMNVTAVNTDPDQLNAPFIYVSSNMSVTQLSMLAVYMNYSAFLRFDGRLLEIDRFNMQEIMIPTIRRSLILLKEGNSKVQITNMHCAHYHPGITPLSQNYIIEIFTGKSVDASITNFTHRCSNLQLAKMINVNAAYRTLLTPITLVVQQGTIHDSTIPSLGYLFEGIDDTVKNTNQLIVKSVLFKNIQVDYNAHLFNTDGTLHLSVINCSFTNIKSIESSVFHLSNTIQVDQMFNLFNSSFNNSQVQNIIMVEKSVRVQVEGTKFTNINGSSNGVVIYTHGVSNSAITLTRCLIQNVRSSHQGVVFISQQNHLVVNHLTVTRVLVQQAPFAVILKSSFSISDINISDCQSLNGTVTMHIGNCRDDIESTLDEIQMVNNQVVDSTNPSVLSISNCRFVANKVKISNQKYGFMLVDQSVVRFTNLLVDNSFPLAHTLFNLSYSSLSLIGMNQSLDSIVPLFNSTEGSQVNLSNIHFYDSRITSIIIMQKTNQVSTWQSLEITNCTISTLIEIQSVKLFEVVGSKFNQIQPMENSQVHQMFKVQQSKLTLLDDQINGVMDLDLLQGTKSELVLDQVQIKEMWYGNHIHTQLKVNEQHHTSTGINCDLCRIKVINSRVQSINGSHQGGFITSTPSLFRNFKPSIQITNSTFTNIHSSNSGGVVFVFNVNLQAIDSTFIGNHAVVNGGALSLNCDSIGMDSPLCSFTLSNSTFNGNMAGTSGGAFSTNLLSPTNYITNTYFNNSAPYGNDYSGVGVRLGLMGGYIKQIKSGQIMKQSVAILDQFGQVVISDNSNIVQVVVRDDDQGRTSMQKQIQATSLMGIAHFTKLKVVATPGTTSSFMFETSNFDSSVLKVVKSASHNIQMSIPVMQCEKGEIYFDNQCIWCPVTQYVLTLNRTRCDLNCPKGVTCLGGDLFKLQPNYWRSSNVSDQVFKCVQKGACGGGLKSVNCVKGYSGNLCHKCQSVGSEVYARLGWNQCVKCSSIFLTLFIVCMTLIFKITYILILIFMNSKVSLEVSDTEVLLKILTTYLQVISIASQMEMEWPVTVKGYFSPFSFASDSTDNIVSVDCVFKLLFSSAALMDEFLLKLIVQQIFPIPAMLTILFIALLYLLIKKKLRQEMKKYFMLTFMVVLYVQYPTLTKYTFSIFPCSPLTGGQQWVTSQLQVRCHSSQHLVWIVAVGVPSLLIYIIGFPLLEFLLMFRNRNHLNSMKTLPQYYFFYKGLKPNRYYWEILETINKILIISAALFVGNPVIKCVLILLLLVLKLQLIQILQPYIKPQHNQTNRYSTIAAILVIYFGVFYVSGADMRAIIILSIILIAANTYFIIYWGWCYLKAIKTKLQVYQSKIKNLIVKLKQSKSKNKIKDMQALDQSNNEPRIGQLNSTRQMLNTPQHRHFVDSKLKISLYMDKEIKAAEIVYKNKRYIEEDER